MEKKRRGTQVRFGQKNLVIGLPRAMLYHRYGVLWEVFFQNLGVEVKVSEETNNGIMEEGAALAIDEMCLSVKIFLGHVRALIGQCDYILVPRITRFGVRREMCTRFAALYDMTCSIFRESGQKFLTYNIDEKNRYDEEAAFEEMGMCLGFRRKDVGNAYKAAKKAEADHLKKQIRQQEEKYKKPGEKILLVGHSYVAEDAGLGRRIVQFLEESGAVVLRADLMDRKEGLKKSVQVSPTMKWEINRELAGTVQAQKEKADGIILLSVFPCGPDSMTSEMIIRKNRDIPMLNLVMDGQEGMAGIETRLESFLDIIRFRKGGENHGEKTKGNESAGVSKNRKL